MRFNTLAEWLAWQETLHPNEIDLGLERVAKVLRRLQLQSPSFTVTTVAGTNGKGSSVAMLDAILRAAGHSVGCYTSPHLLRYNERIRINGREIDDASLCAAFERVDQARGDVSLTYFEFGTLAAIDILQRHAVDIAVLEVGLGGRLDAVNVLEADVALITAIDVDHVSWLGSDRETIAREKAGILRSGHPAVCSDPHPPQSLLAYAQQYAVPLLLTKDRYEELNDQQWCWLTQDHEAIELPLPGLQGDFQLANAAGVLGVLEQLTDRFPVTTAAIQSGLRDAKLAGRFQVIPGQPLRIFDVAHNPQSMQSLVQNLQHQACAGRTRMVVSMLMDKDIKAALSQLKPLVHDWYLAPLKVSRAASIQQLQAALGEIEASVSCQYFPDVATAYQQALKDAQSQDRIVVAGSFYTVADALAQAV